MKFESIIHYFFNTNFLQVLIITVVSKHNDLKNTLVKIKFDEILSKIRTFNVSEAMMSLQKIFYL